MRKAVKVALWVIAIIIMLLLIAVLCLNSQWGQNIVRGKAVAYLTDKLKTEVRIGHLGVSFPKFIAINDVLLLDQAQDTLLAVGELKIDLSMMALVHKEIDVQQLVLTGVHAHVYRSLHDTDFNFTYIINAFASGKPKDTSKVQDTAASPLKVTVGKVNLNDIHVRFDDYTGGTRLAVNLDELSLKMNKVELDKMRFHIKELSVSGLQGAFTQDTSYLPPSTQQSGKAALQLIADNIDLEKISFKYRDNVGKLLFTTQVGKLQLQLNNFDLAENIVVVKTLSVGNTDLTLVMGKQPNSPTPLTDTAADREPATGWQVIAGDVQLNGVHFSMDNENNARLPKGIDYAHLNVRDIALVLEDASYNSDSLAGNLKHLSATEHSGVQIKELRTAFKYNGHGAVLNDLYLETANTILQDHLEVHYASLDSIQAQLAEMQLDVHLQNSKIAVSDILLFVPGLEKQELFLKNKDANIDLEATLAGKMDSLDIAHLYVGGLSNTEVLLSGTLRGLPDAEQISYSFDIEKLQSSAKDVSAFVPDSVLAAIRIPDKFIVAGGVAGTINDYTTNINIASTDGLVHMRGTLFMSPGKGKEQYDMVVNTAALNLGRILRQDSLLGAVSTHLVAKGTGFDPQTMNASIDGNIISAFVKGYRYHDINLYGKMAAQKGTLDLMCADPNIHLQVKGQGDFSGKYPAVSADIRIDSIDLQALKLSATELRASGTMHADFPELNPDYPRGRFIWWQPTINASGEKYYLDSLYVISTPTKTGQNINADLGVLTASITGNVPLTKIAPIIQDQINRHYATAGVGGSKRRDTSALPAAYTLNIAADVIDKPMLRSLLPNLTSFEDIHLAGSITPRTMNLDVSIPNVVYAATTVKNGIVEVRSTDSAFTYQITANEVSLNKYSFWLADIHGRLNRDTITTSFSISDESGIKRFALAADLQTKGDSQIVHLWPGLKLDYRDWAVAQPNRIVLGKDGFYVSNFEISDSGKYIRAHSLQPTPNAPMKVDINNFMLSDVTNAISNRDTLLLGGLLSGTIDVAQFSPSLKVTSDLKIADLSFLRDTLGNLDLQVNNKQEQTLEAKIKLTEHGNDIAIDGFYFLKPNGGDDFRFDIGVHALAVHSFETLAMSQIRNSSGNLRGNLKLNGTVAAPRITGELRTDNLVTTVSQLNATLKMPAEKIRFSGDQVSFDNFTIHDDADNVATIDGSINIADLAKMDMDMRLKANKWHALNSTAKDNDVFYGDLFLTTNLTMKGNPAAPKVEGALKILKGTEVTVVNPEFSPEIENRTGIVKFVNMKDTGRMKTLVSRKKDTVNNNLALGADFNVNVTIDKSADFSLIIDKVSGDFLKVKGDANINVSMPPHGNMSLTGSYALADGAYQLNYNFVKRKFKIAKGSTITFAGDPITGTILDVTAVYEAQVSPYDLVQREISDPAQLNFYKQRLPFNVNLFMNGPILNPRLTFDIILPENKAYKLSADKVDLVQGKLSQVRTDTSELNKQVFAVLILNRFVSDDPFSSNSGSSASFTAMQSVSTFIGEQLNRAAGKLVKGVDFSVDLATTEDYSNGSLRQRTDLNLAASKQLLNDRLKLTLGNNFELEGAQSGNTTQSSYVPTNLAADYLLSADGKYTLRVYRKAYDVGVLQGFVTETGLNIIVSFDYNKFRKAVVPKKSKDEKKKKKKE